MEIKWKVTKKEIPKIRCEKWQWFLKKIFLQITDGEKGMNEIQQWPINIQARVPNSPVIIVGNFLLSFNFSNQMQTIFTKSPEFDYLFISNKSFPKKIVIMIYNKIYFLSIDYWWWKGYEWNPTMANQYSSQSSK